MRVFEIDFRKIPDLPESVCAIGYFDGLHRGHQQLIALARHTAAQKGLKSAVLTFDPDPWQVLKPEADLSHLTSLKDKTQILSAMDVDLFYVVRFSREFAALSVDAFHSFLKAMHIAEIVCGFDFTYGAMGKGNTRTLAGCTEFVTDVVSEISDADEKISSSRIEALIRKGDIAKANSLLGYLYSIGGSVEHGYERGRQMGFPTANLTFAPESILPASGVYAGFVQVGNDLLAAMINVGHNPTFAGRRQTVEANILGEDLNLYGLKTRFFFAARLRGEEKFPSMEALKAQLICDQQATQAVLPQSQKLFAPTAKLWSLDSVNAILFK